MDPAQRQTALQALAATKEPVAAGSRMHALSHSPKAPRPAVTSTRILILECLVE